VHAPWLGRTVEVAVRAGYSWPNGRLAAAPPAIAFTASDGGSPTSVVAARWIVRSHDRSNQSASPRSPSEGREALCPPSSLGRKIVEFRNSRIRDFEEEEDRDTVVSHSNFLRDRCHPSPHPYETMLATIKLAAVPVQPAACSRKFSSMKLSATMRPVSPVSKPHAPDVAGMGLRAANSVAAKRDLKAMAASGPTEIVYAASADTGTLCRFHACPVVSL